MTWERNEEGLYKSTKQGYDPTTIVNAFDSEVREDANRMNAMTWSSPITFPSYIDIPENEKIIGFAKFGDKMAVNETPVEERPDFSDLEEVEDSGGRIPVTEAEVILEDVAREVAERFDDLDGEDVINIVERFKDVDLSSELYNSTSGYATYYKAKEDKAKKKLNDILGR